MESRVSSEQLEILLDHLLTHPTLARGIGLGGRSRETSERLWDDLATKLNATGSGSYKSGALWKRYWIDLKYKARSKAAMLRREHSGTGGGPSHQKPLSDTYKKVLSIIGEEAAYGDVQFRVPAFDHVQNEMEVLSDTRSQPSVKRQIFPQSEVVEIIEGAEGGLSPTLQEQKIAEMPSPSTRGRTPNTVFISSRCSKAENILQNIPNEDCHVENLLADSPPTQPRTSHSKIRARYNPRIRTENSWVIDLERRRVAAEEKLSDAIKIIAEASKMNAEAAMIQAEAFREQTKALVELMQLLKR